MSDNIELDYDFYHNEDNIFVDDGEGSVDDTDPTQILKESVDADELEQRVDDLDIPTAEYSAGTANVDVIPDNIENYDQTVLVDSESETNIEIVVEELPIYDFNESYLKALHDDGWKFYAIYTDGTEQEVAYTDVKDPFNNAAHRVVWEADMVGAASNQKFWNDDNGIHVSSTDKDLWNLNTIVSYQSVDEPIEDDLDFYYEYDTNIDEYVLTDDISINNSKTYYIKNESINDSNEENDYHNILVNSLGILLRKAYFNLASVTRSAIAFYDGTGNDEENILAFFGALSAQIGRSNRNHVVITSNGVTAYKGDGTLDELIAVIDGVHLKNASIAGSKIIEGTITNSNIADSTITGSKIQGSTLTNIPFAEIDEIKSRNITASQLSAATAYISALTAGNVTTEQLSAATAYISALTAANVSAQNLLANVAKVSNLTAEQLSAATAYIAALIADNVSAANIIADHGDFNTVKANAAKVNDLTAAQLSAATAYIAALTAGNVTAANIVADHGDFNTVKANAAKVTDLTAAQLSAATGYISTLLADNLAAADIIADHAEIDSLDTTYAQIDMANVNNAWIENGVVKDGSITNAMINSVSANKLTAGTIDASNITVTNLNASNITTGTINGQRIGTGSLSLDKLADDVYTESEVDSLLATMQSEIDGAIETWTGTAVPTLQNTPASEWTTNTDKDKHIGDVYFVVNSELQQNGYNYRFTKTGSAYSWQLIKDSDVTAALSRLSTAEGKITTFESDISTLQTNTGSLTTRTTSLETRTTTVESSLLDKVDTTDFNDLSDTVDEHTQTLTQHTTAISNKADNSTVTTLSNTVSSVQQTVNGNSSKLTQLITTLGTNADGTTKTGDVVQRTSAVEQDLSGFKTTVSNTYATKSTVDGIDTRVSSAETQISQNANAILLKANASDVYSTTAANALLAVKANKDTLTSEINASADTVKINANRVDIAGAAIFTSGRLSEASLNQAYGNQSTALTGIQRIYYQCNDSLNVPATPGTATSNWVSDTTGNSDTWTLKRMSYDSQKPYIWTCFQIKNTSGTISYSDVLLDDTTTVIDGGKILTGSITANKINTAGLTIGQNQVTNLASDLSDAMKHTQVIVSASNVDYVANTCTLTARFYVDGVLQTDSSLKWQWYRDGTVQGSQTTGSTGSLSVTSALGIAHRYACKCTF